MEIVKIWQNLEKNATQIKIFLPHYMWAENKNFGNCFEPSFYISLSYKSIIRTVRAENVIWCKER